MIDVLPGEQADSRRPAAGSEGGVRPAGHFRDFVLARRSENRLILQPRMGFSDPALMRRGLELVRAATAPTIGTITLDSYTRMGDLEGARRALDAGKELNGYPIVTYGEERNRRLVDGLLGAAFPIQIRHGSPLPEPIFRALIAAGIEATEGGPISYCLPYSRVPLAATVRSWQHCCRMLAGLEQNGVVGHLESFGGCMLGQLCPPAMLLTLTLLEARFFREHGIKSLSLSYAQGYNEPQDVGAILALRQLASESLQDVDWHVVVYCFMGNFPRSRSGSRRLIEDSARLAVKAGAARLIVKTGAEAYQIPTIEDNLEAIEWSRLAAAQPKALPGAAEHRHREALYAETSALLAAILDLAPTVGEAIQIGFREGYLDVPFCLHPDNRNRARSWLDGDGSIYWSDPGRIPLPAHLRDAVGRPRQISTSRDLAKMLAFNQERYDAPAAARPDHSWPAHADVPEV